VADVELSGDLAGGEVLFEVEIGEVGFTSDEEEWRE
jgi:hypothetical protein